MKYFYSLFLFSLSFILFSQKSDTLNVKFKKDTLNYNFKFQLLGGQINNLSNKIIEEKEFIFSPSFGIIFEKSILKDLYFSIPINYSNKNYVEYFETTSSNGQSNSKLPVYIYLKALDFRPGVRLKLFKSNFSFSSGMIITKFLSGKSKIKWPNTPNYVEYDYSQLPTKNLNGYYFQLDYKIKKINLGLYLDYLKSNSELISDFENISISITYNLFDKYRKATLSSGR